MGRSCFYHQFKPLVVTIGARTGVVVLQTVANSSDRQTDRHREPAQIKCPEVPYVHFCFVFVLFAHILTAAPIAT